jgi:hypothetical protein
MLVVGLMSACSSSGTLTVTQPKTQGIPPGQTVSLAVELDVAEPLPVHQEVATRIRERLFGRLVSDGIFRAVVHAPEPADYRMDVKIRGAREVSTGARIMLGAMIGPNTTTVAVAVRHEATNQLLTAFEATGTSAAHPLSSEAGLDDAVREAVVKIIEGLR